MCNILTRVGNCDGFSYIRGKTNPEESSNKNKLPKGEQMIFFFFIFLNYEKYDNTFIGDLENTEQNYI